MRKTLLITIAVIGVVVVAAGLWSALHPLAFASGWTAYSPLSDSAYLPAFGPPWWSLVMVVLGSAATGAAAALLLAAHIRPRVFTD